MRVRVLRRKDDDDDVVFVVAAVAVAVAILQQISTAFVVVVVLAGNGGGRRRFRDCSCAGTAVGRSFYSGGSGYPPAFVIVGGGGGNDDRGVGGRCWCDPLGGSSNGFRCRRRRLPRGYPYHPNAAQAGARITAQRQLCSRSGWFRRDSSLLALPVSSERRQRNDDRKYYNVGAGVTNDGDDRDGGGIATAATTTIECVRVTLDLPNVGPVSILEATAGAQETLVDLALQELEEVGDDSDDGGRRLELLPNGDPYGAVLWPAAYAVASHLLRNVDVYFPRNTAVAATADDDGDDDSSSCRHRGDDDDDEEEAEEQKRTEANQKNINNVILELGAGTGLVSLAVAAMHAAAAGNDVENGGGSSSSNSTGRRNQPLMTKTTTTTIIATDYESIPLRLLRYAATSDELNEGIRRSGCRVGDGDNDAQSLSSLSSSIPPSSSSCTLRTQLFDICDTEKYPNLPIPPPPNDDPECGNNVVVVAADVMYEPKTGRALARRVVDALRSGCRVVIGDSPGRAGRPAFLEELHGLLSSSAPSSSSDSSSQPTKIPPLPAFVDAKGWTVTGDRHELICGPTSQTVSRRRGGEEGGGEGEDGPAPRELTVAILELDPEILLGKGR